MPVHVTGTASAPARPKVGLLSAFATGDAHAPSCGGEQPPAAVHSRYWATVTGYFEMRNAPTERPVRRVPMDTPMTTVD
jgi:hypothetical protein